MKIHIVILIGILLLCSCTTTKYVEVPITLTKIEYRTDSIYILNSDIKADSVYIKDSISTIIKDSLIYVDRWHTQYTYKYISSADTLYKDKLVYITDSIEKPVYITKEVEVNKLYTWQKILMWIGGSLLLGILIYIALKIYTKTWLPKL